MDGMWLCRKERTLDMPPLSTNLHIQNKMCISQERATVSKIAPLEVAASPQPMHLASQEKG